MKKPVPCPGCRYLLSPHIPDTCPECGFDLKSVSMKVQKNEMVVYLLRAPSGKLVQTVFPVCWEGYKAIGSALLQEGQWAPGTGESQ